MTQPITQARSSIPNKKSSVPNSELSSATGPAFREYDEAFLHATISSLERKVMERDQKISQYQNQMDQL